MNRFSIPSSQKGKEIKEIWFRWLMINFLTLCAVSVSAQSDEVYLQDGRTVVGLIVEEVPFQYVKVQTEGFKIVTVYQEDIKDIYRPIIKGYWNAVYHKNGGLLNGFIVRYKYDDFLIVENERGYEFEYFAADILRITKEKVPTAELMRRSGEGQKEARKLAKKANKPRSRGGMFYFLEVGGMLVSGRGDEPFPGMFFNQVLSYKFNERFAFGGGVGFDALYRVEGGRDLGRVIFADSRFYFPDSKLNPYFSISGGYDWFRDGWTVFPGFGANIPIVKKSTLNLGAGLRIQKIGENSNNLNNLRGLLEIVQFKIVID